MKENLMKNSGCYIKNNNTIRVISEGAVTILNELPLATYIVQENIVTGELYLEKISDFNEQKKVYGKTDAHIDRIIKTFEDRAGNTGILLSGAKGSGKTFLAKKLSEQLLKKNYSTILINDVFDQTTLSKFIQDISEPVLIIFDEFEKIYKEGGGGSKDLCKNKESSDATQNSLLSLLDGLFSTKKLFVFTCNYEEDITDLMKNRPGRVFYHITFNGMEKEAISEYCDEKLINKEYKNQIINISRMIEDFTFDMLQAIVEESNRYNENPIDALSLLNVRPKSGYNSYNVDVQSLDSKVTVKLDREGSVVRCNPLGSDNIYIYLHLNKERDVSFFINSSNLVKYEENEITFIKDNIEVILRKIEITKDFWKLIA